MGHKWGFLLFVFYLFLVSNGVCCRSSQSQPDYCFLNSAAWSWWGGRFYSDLLQFYESRLIDDKCGVKTVMVDYSFVLSLLVCPIGAAWGSAHSGGISWWRSHRSRGLPPPTWHPSAVRPTSPRHRAHSCRTGKTAHAQTQTPPGSRTRVHRHSLFVTG